jgi:hypothetical protein
VNSSKKNSATVMTASPNPATVGESLTLRASVDGLLGNAHGLGELCSGRLCYRLGLAQRLGRIGANSQHDRALRPAVIRR